MIKKKEQIAITSSWKQDQTLFGYICGGTTELLEELEYEQGSLELGDSLGYPETPGLWLWEGEIKIRHDKYDGTEDIEFKGKFRRPTVEEISKFLVGDPIWK